jgi:hypothetical protein
MEERVVELLVLSTIAKPPPAEPNRCCTDTAEKLAMRPAMEKHAVCVPLATEHTFV